MEEQKFSFTGSFQKTKEYVETQLELLKLRAIAESAKIAGAVAVDMTKLLLSLIIVFFLSLALGFFLGELLNSNALGFLVTALIFIIILLVVIARKPKLESKFTDLVINRIMSKCDEYDDLDIDDKVNEVHNSNKKKAEETNVEDFYEKEENEHENKD